MKVHPTTASKTRGLFPRYSRRLNGLLLCDLYSLTAKRKEVELALSRFAGSAWTADYHPAHVLDEDSQRVCFPGSAIGLQTIIASMAALVGVIFLIGLISPALPASQMPFSLTPAALSTEAAVVYTAWVRVRRRCQLSLDPQQVTFTIGRHVIPLPWETIADIRILRENVSKDNKIPKAPMYEHRVLVTFRQEIKLSPHQWSLVPCCTWGNTGLRLVAIDAFECQLLATPDRVDQALKAFAGPRYLPPTNG